MNPLRRAVASVIRVLGAGAILLSLALLALLWVAHRKAPVPWWQWTLYAVPAAVAGTVLCVKSSALAQRLTDDYDE